jgi:gluconokinase
MTDSGAPPVVVVTGVSGSGKTTVAAMLAGRLGWRFAEGDDFHPPANIAKMAAGHPLDDEDRWPWLAALGAWIDARRAAHQPGVVTCSALKRRYRDFLAKNRPEVRFVFLDGDSAVIHQRMAARQGHYMRADMLASQLADLERPQPDEHIVTVRVRGSAVEVVDEVIAALGLPTA